MRSRAFRPIATILSILLLASTPVQAGPVSVSQVVQVVGNYHSPPQLRLRGVTQAASSTAAGSLVNQTPGDRYVDTSTGKTLGGTTDPLLSGIAIGNPEQQGGVDVVAQGDLEGVICDCGEIVIPGGISKWPLIFLAAIPFFFWPDCDDCDPPCLECDNTTPTPTPPTPTPTPPPEIPEPASLLLLGTGLAALGAGLRRRLDAKARNAGKDSTSEEG